MSALNKSRVPVRRKDHDLFWTPDIEFYLLKEITFFDNKMVSPMLWLEPRHKLVAIRQRYLLNILSIRLLISFLSQRYMLKIDCPMNLEKYPMDVQNCHLDFKPCQ